MYNEAPLTVILLLQCHLWRSEIAYGQANKRYRHQRKQDISRTPHQW